jgi:hypothetical protein
MLDATIFDWGPAVAVVSVVAFALDWSLTHVGARAFQRVRHIWDVEGSYELNPTWQAEVDAGRRFSWRAAAVALLLFVLLVAMWLVVEISSLGASFFAFAAGAVLLVQAPTLLLHAANLQTFRTLADPTAVQGAIRLSRWYVYDQSAWAYARFALLWLVLWPPSQQLFFAGGALGCGLLGFRMLGLGRRLRPTA